MRFTAVLSSALLLVFTGCALSPTAAPNASSGLSLRGNIRGGNQPISGAHVYLLAANTTGYGAASASLLNSASTGNSDSLGAYVLSDSLGGFTITGDYACTLGQQVYLYTLGGDPGAGANSAASLMAVLGSCPASGNFLSQFPLIQVNELTTVAAAYALAPFATDATHVSSSGTTLAQTGIANAFTNAANLASITTGGSLATTPAGNGTVPQTEINTIANVLASCINSTGPGSATCSTLFSSALSAGATGTAPSDVATAAINIAHNPAANVAALYALQAAAGSPFLPELSAAPHDFTVTILIPASSTTFAVDASGNVWTCGYNATAGGFVLLEYSSAGALLTPSGITGAPACSNPAVDPSGNVWVTTTSTISPYNSSLYKFSSAGALLAGPITGNSLVNSRGIAIDGTGNIWVANYGTNALSKFTSTGAVATNSPFTGNGLSFSNSLAIDSTGAVWVQGANLSKFNNDGSAAILPISAYNNKLSGPPVIDASNNIWLPYSGSGTTGILKLGSDGSNASGSPFTGGGASQGAFGLAMDGASSVWADSQATAFGTATLIALTNAGAPISPSDGFQPINVDESNDPIVVDLSGSIWVNGAIVGSDNSIIAITIGAASPVVTPTSLGVKNHTLGTRP